MPPSLMVDRTELVRALGVLAKQVKRKHVGDAIISYEDGKLRIDLDGLSVKAAAEGEWPGRARVAASFAVAAAGLDFPNEQVSIRIVPGLIYIERFFRSCEWQHDAVDLIQLPVNPSTLTVLAKTLDHTPAEIRRSGISEITYKAEERREDLILRAATRLKPLGVGLDDVRELVDRAIRRAADAS